MTDEPKTPQETPAAGSACSAGLGQFLPCPFCGHTGPAFNTVKYDKATVKEQGWRQDLFFGVSCPACGVNNRGIVGFKTKEEAAEHWNRRA